MLSPRIEFQLKYYHRAPQDSVEPQILNVGSADDPIGLGETAMHVDIDDWSYKHRHFTQADATTLPFSDQSYHTVICGDVMEHVVSPLGVVEQLCRVCKDTLVLTIFEEWRLPDHGQFIKEGQALGDNECKRLGYEDREDFQKKIYPERVGFDDDAVPHLIHINQFNDEDIQDMINYIVMHGFQPIELVKAPEAVHEGHQWYNWLLAFQRRVG